MKKLMLILALFALALTSGRAMAEGLINGAGATFPYPLYSKWSYEYAKSSGAKLNYQSIGSGGGIKQIKAKTVDFGASDAPLVAKDLEESGLMQFPMAIGGVVPVVNLKGIKPGEMKLTPAGSLIPFLQRTTLLKKEVPSLYELSFSFPDDSIT